MKVSLTLDLDDNVRRKLRNRLGRTGLATREECAQHLRALLISDLETIESDPDIPIEREVQA